MTMRANIIHATCTPLQEDESLDFGGTETHVEAQWHHGATGLLIGGTMGLMQLLRWQTFVDLVRHSVLLSRQRGEVLIGVGDTSHARTLERIRFAETEDVDGLVVLTPYFFKYSAQDLVDYYRCLAAESSKPIFVYYLPALTGVSLSLETVLQIARIPNVAGIKSSADFAWTSSLAERVPTGFRVIAAAPSIFSKLLRIGFPEQLDGIFAVVPAHTRRIVEAARQKDWAETDRLQGQLNDLVSLLAQKYGIFPGTTALLNAQGISGRCAIRPMQELSAEQAGALLREPAVNACLTEHAADASWSDRMQTAHTANGHSQKATVTATLPGHS